MLPLVVLAWDTFWETTLTNQTKVVVVWNYKSIWDAIRSTPGASPPHLSGRTGRGESGACIGKGQTKSDQGRKTSVESLSTLPSRAGRDTFSRKKPWLWMPLFSLLQMGANSFRTTPLKSIKKKKKKNWDKFDPQSLKRHA